MASKKSDSGPPVVFILTHRLSWQEGVGEILAVLSTREKLDKALDKYRKDKDIDADNLTWYEIALDRAVRLP